MRFLNTQPIRRQVVVVATLLMLPFIAAAIWSSRRTLREHEDELREQAASISTTSAAYLNQFLDGLDTLSSALTRHPDVRALRRDECDRLFADVLKDQPLILNILVTNREGAVRGSAVAARYSAEAVRLPYLSQVITAGRPIISDLTIGQVSRKPTIILGYPVRDDEGAVVGVLGLGVNLERLQTVFSSIPLPEGSVVTLTDRASRVLARSLEPERFIGTTVSQAPLDPKDAPSTVTSTGMDGVSRIFGNAQIERGPWLLSVGIPRSVATARVLPLWRRNVLISSVGIAVVFLFSLWLAQHLSGQLNLLRVAAQKIAGGDLSPPARAHSANLELAQLQDAFVTMAANLRETRDALDHQVEQERKMREVLQSLQRQVVRQERLAAVGLLVSGVAHELNNPLQAILGTAELLERQQELGGNALDEIAFMKTQAGRAREIIRNLSRFSSQQSGPPELVDLRDVVAEVIQLRRRDVENGGITLDVEGSSTRTVHANFTEIEQVVLNFVINAQQSLESSGRDKGRIRIRLSDFGKRVLLEVLDNGPGVNPEDEPKLFQPFFTTKPVGKGTGLGLSVSYGIIDSYGGTIGYRRNEWSGATFFFELPSSDAAAARAPASQADGSTTTPPPSDHDRAPVLHRPVLPRV